MSRSGNAIAVVGCGLMTPLGGDTADTWAALMGGRAIRDQAMAWTDTRQMRVLEIALGAANEALGQAGWGPAQVSDGETALIVGTSRGTLENYLTPLPHMAENAYIVGGQSGWGIGQLETCLARELGFGTGPRMTVSAACASGLQALICGAMELGSGSVRRVLVVAAEASVHPLFLGAFRRMGVLADPQVGCRPFDRDREGFLVSEIGAAVCLESAAVSAGRSPIAWVDRFALGCDAQHVTSSDPEGQVLRRLLTRVIDGRPVDLIHAHGTGTRVNDEMELAAIEATVLPGSVPAVYSHKGALGHSLGAAGLASIVINCLCHDHGMVPGNVRTEDPLPTTRVRISQKPISREIRRTLAISAGFGGATTVVSLLSGTTWTERAATSP